MKFIFQFVFVLNILNFFFALSSGKTADESATGSLLKFPYVSDGSLFNISWEVAPSQFGFHDYGGSIEGYLVLPANTSYHLECISEPLNINPYVHWILDWDVLSSDNKNWIMVIDRGSCYFVNKVYNAQLLGASAVIVLDTHQENLFTMWEPDGYTSNITIPSVLLGYNNAMTLMKHLGVINWDGNMVIKNKSTIYPSPENMTWTIAKIEWGLPHFDDRVEWELWTDGADPDSIDFKKNFRSTSLNLSAQNDTVFTPHMYIVNGTEWGCTQTTRLPCGNQCSNSGRYCSVDPDNNIKTGVSGMDVVQENLRELCVWEYAQDNGLGEAPWWDYSILWNTYCFNGVANASTFTANCSFTQMAKVDSALPHYVRQCINASGGYDQYDGINTLLEAESALRADSSIYALPMVVVNQFLIHGDISCSVVTTQQCQVLDAICAGFINGTQPSVCYATPSPTPVTCADDLKDCAGVCYGTYLNDSCGQCLPVSSSLWNDCVGCDGQPYSNKTTDCKGVCGGIYMINTCGYCIPSVWANFSTYGTDCNGTCDGSKMIDRCGQCLLQSDSSFDSCVGCDGVVNSTKTTNVCGYCIPEKWSNFTTYGQDCSGVCDGSKIIDRCGHCLLASDPDFDSCIGCDFQTDRTLNPCNYCIFNNATDFNTYGMDCRGECDTSGAYQIDNCGVCRKINDASWNKCDGCDGVKDSNTTWRCGVCVQINTYEYDHACDNSTIAADSSSKSLSVITTLIIVISVIAFIVIIVAGYIIHRLWKRQQQVDDNFKTILQSYQVMEDANTKSKTSSKPKKEYKNVPDEEEHDQTL